MNNSIFNDLQTSMKQAEAIAKGDTVATKITRFEIADVKAIRLNIRLAQSRPFKGESSKR